MFKYKHLCEHRTGQVRRVLDDRKKEIVDIIHKKGRVSVRELATSLYVTEMTIRRDLTELEKSGFIKRYRGGAVIRQTEGDLPVAERFFVEEEEKKAISLKAEKYLHDNMTVYIDSSSTAQYLISHLARYSNIEMITNSVRACLTAERFHIPCTLLGGRYYERDMCLVGPVADEMAGSFNVDIAFFSTLGITDDGVISDNDLMQSAVRRIIMKNAKQNIFLFEKGKLGNKYKYTICRSDDVTVIFPD